MLKNLQTFTEVAAMGSNMSNYIATLTKEEKQYILSTITPEEEARIQEPVDWDSIELPQWYKDKIAQDLQDAVIIDEC